MLAFRNSTEIQDLVVSWKPKPWTGTNGSLVVRVVACPLVPTANGSQRLQSQGTCGTINLKITTHCSWSLLKIHLHFDFHARFCFALGTQGHSPLILIVGFWWCIWALGVSSCSIIKLQSQDFWTIKDHEIMIGDLILNRDSRPSLISL